jgi:hypothetical protein
MDNVTAGDGHQDTQVHDSVWVDGENIAVEDAEISYFACLD